MTRYILTLLIIGISANTTAEPVSFQVFSMDVADEWTYLVEQSTTISDTPGELISVYQPNGSGVMKMMSYVAPGIISMDRLRLITNVEISTTLPWQEWGDLSGYHYSYIENEKFYKQWWLLNEGTIIWITYESVADEPRTEIETIDQMVNSIKLNLF